ncbi:branched-chain amino acid transport system II carrier protein [Paenisporosarcina quisquiliarum]|uniref:Branched-chain amino acid transport system carrier protein n=1 Tax=Paenisporosarcina quisquiliarum TaxID=365346 RepID=A0A9X3LF80_9BACL|nr:branched-chain amino acid transport system II carrier protein [Paenisporosarcina quisquiliarum]MCZ8536667.1 branched-chain amino acid transport system II carrier protein [Paenisporosarcina quisquiliarum]
MKPNNTLTTGENIIVGLMLFALFLGAGNIIFPPLLGQLSGEALVISIFGFLITGVGLPLLAVIAIAKSGGDLQEISSRVHPLFGLLFTVVVYLVIGPLFAIPRTATVSFEIGVAPFLSEALLAERWPLLLFSILFFVVTVLFALNPTKLVDRIGKILTPILIVVIALLAIKSIVSPMGKIGPSHGAYKESPFFESFLQGYLTMDVLAALVFGIVVIHALQDKGVREKKLLVKSTIIAGVIAAFGLSLVYISLSYIGATSVDAIGIQDNGGSILALASNELFGSFGSIILAMTIAFACLTTSIGLVAAASQFFEKLLPKVSYRMLVFIFAGFSAVFANVGLTQLINFSVPVLLALYPLAIVLMALSFFDKAFDRAPIVYGLALLFTSFISIFDGFKAAGITFDAAENMLVHLPLYTQGIGWLLPGILGGLIGFILYKIKK